jgi:hypothetical protein
MTRLLFGLAVFAGATWFGTGAGEAYYQGRWCATVATGNGSVREICHFNDFAACAAEVVSGNRGFCGPNPYRSGDVSIAPRKRR